MLGSDWLIFLKLVWSSSSVATSTWCSVSTSKSEWSTFRISPCSSPERGPCEQLINGYYAITPAMLLRLYGWRGTIILFADWSVYPNYSKPRLGCLIFESSKAVWVQFIMNKYARWIIDSLTYKSLILYSLTSYSYKLQFKFIISRSMIRNYEVEIPEFSTMNSLGPFLYWITWDNLFVAFYSKKKSHNNWGSSPGLYGSAAKQRLNAADFRKRRVASEQCPTHNNLPLAHLAIYFSTSEV